MSFMNVFKIFGLVSNWYGKAMADGEVTLKEGLQLIVELAEVIGLNVAPEVMEFVTQTAKDTLDAVDEAVDSVREGLSVVDNPDTDGLKNSR